MEFMCDVRALWLIGSTLSEPELIKVNEAVKLEVISDECEDDGLYKLAKIIS